MGCYGGDITAAGKGSRHVQLRGLPGAMLGRKFCVIPSALLSLR